STPTTRAPAARSPAALRRPTVPRPTTRTVRPFKSSSIGYPGMGASVRAGVGVISGSWPGRSAPTPRATRYNDTGVPSSAPDEGVAVATAPPRARHVQSREAGVYVRKADRVTVRHRHGQVVAVVEIVSPGNKASNAELRAFVQKAADLIQQGVNLLVVDL